MSSMTKASNAAAGHRRLAYQCVRCLHRDGKAKIDAKYRIVDHFMVNHVALDDAPFHCRLCHFVTTKKEDLEKHVKGYPRHQLMLKEKGLCHSDSMLVESTTPYKITSRDVAQLTPEESRAHWEERRDKRNVIMQQAVDAAFGEDFGKDETPTPAAAPLSQPQTPGSTIDASAILMPLQQLVSLFGGGIVNPAASTPLPPVSSGLTANQMVPNLPEATKTGRAPSPIPSVPETVGILNLPTIEECRALAREAPESSSSSDSSSSRKDCKHHHEILQEISSLREAVDTLKEHFVKQYGTIQDLASKLLEMAGRIAMPNQTPAAPPVQAFQVQPPPPPPQTQPSMSSRPVGPPHADRRDRSPLRRLEARRPRDRTEDRYRVAHGRRERF